MPTLRLAPLPDSSPDFPVAFITFQHAVCSFILLFICLSPPYFFFFKIL